MKRLTVEFSMATIYQGSTQSEEKTFDFADDESEREIEDYLTAAYSEWVLENIGGGWRVEKTENIEEE